jgi:hypothetical protein
MTRFWLLFLAAFAIAASPLAYATLTLPARIIA